MDYNYSTVLNWMIAVMLLNLIWHTFNLASLLTDLSLQIKQSQIQLIIARSQPTVTSDQSVSESLFAWHESQGLQ